MTMTQLRTETDTFLASGNYTGARPFLMELVKRFEGDESTRSNLGPIYYFVGVSFLHEYGSDTKNVHLETAIKWFDKYEENFPNGGFILRAVTARADCKRGLQKFAAAAEDYAKLLTPPLEFQLNTKQRQSAFKKLVQCYYVLKDWTNGVPWFLRFHEEAFDPDDRAIAATALIEAYIAQGEFEKVMRLLASIVGNSPARFQLQFNVALMQAGDKLSKEKRYSEAAFMYRMVLGIEAIRDFNEKRLADLEGQLNLLKLTSTEQSERRTELETEIRNIGAHLTAYESVKSYTADLKMRIARNYLLTKRDWEAFWAFERLIKEYPNSPLIEDNFYSAFTAASEIDFVDKVISMGEEYLNSDVWVKYKNDITLRLCQFYLKREKYEDFFDLAKSFIEKNSGQSYASQIAYFLGTTYMKLERYDEMKSVFNSYVKRFKNVPMEDASHYFSGMASVFERDYDEAAKRFKFVLNNFKDSAYREDSQYRIGICSFGLGDYPGAKTHFETFVKSYPETPLRGEAEFFLGDINAALPNVDQALKHYALVEKFTDNIIYVQGAYFQSGELLIAQKRYEDAVELFLRFVEKYSHVGEFTTAIYQVGVAYENLGRPEDMLKVYFDAIVKYGDDPISYGLDKIILIYASKYYENKTKIAQNLDFLSKLKEEKAFREKIATNRTSLFDYLAENPLIEEKVKRPLYGQAFRNDLVDDTSPLDAFISEYQGLQERFPKETPEEQLETVFEEARDEGRETLQIRMQMALHKLDVTVDDERIFGVDDFDYGSPATLIWMGDQTIEFDTDTARQAYERVITDHPESEQVFTALIRLGGIDEELENYDAAYYYYKQAEELFSTNEGVAQAVIKQGDTLRKRTEYLDARDVYQSVVQNRDWRGEDHAEALFWIATCYQLENRLDDALSYYERVYVGYIAFTEWSSRAYLEAGRIHQKRGDTELARGVYEEFVEMNILQDSEVGVEIKRALNSL